MGTEMLESARGTFGQFLCTLNQKNKTLVRRREKILQKLSRLKSSIVFNKTCLYEGLLPTYTKFQLHESAALEHQSTNARK